MAETACQTATMAEAPKLKDYFTVDVVRSTGERVGSVHPGFDMAAFVDAAIGADWDDLAFTERSRRIGDALWHTLGLEVEPGLDVITALLPAELDDPEGVLNNGFWMWPLGHIIGTYAVDHLEAGLDACEALTKRFTSEFAVRPFLARYPEAMRRVRQWADDPSEHVRRLASEGTRPRLPWATRLALPVDEVLDVLTVLKADDSRYVRTSVANHLNDLAKDDSDRIVSLLEAWHAEDVAETTWIVRRAMRNHLKNGDPRVLALFGYGTADVTVRDLAVTPTSLSIGESVTIAFDLDENRGRDQKLMVDLVVGYVKANGKPSPKVFKFKDFELGAGASESCRKKLEMVNRSTRALYPGTHSVTVRVNGSDLATTHFDVLDDAASATP